MTAQTLANAQSILIVGPAWVGDMVMAQALYKAIKSKQPDSTIDVLAPDWSAGILERMPEVRSLIRMPLGHGQLGWGARRNLGVQLRGKYDRAYVLPNSWKSALVPWFAKIPIRTGYLGEWRYGLLNDIHRLDTARMPRLVDRYVGLCGSKFSPTTSPSLAVEDDGRLRLLEALGLKADPPVLALCPGAEYGPAKRWPLRSYSEVARRHLERGWQVWILGSEKDATPNRELFLSIHEKREVHSQTIGQNAARLASSPKELNAFVVNLTGQTTLAQAVDLLSVAKRIVSNDSGLMHLGAAVDTQMVAVYGSSDPSYTPPLSTRSRIARLGLPCSPCFKKTCPFGHTDCLNKLGAEEVMKLLDGSDW